MAYRLICHVVDMKKESIVKCHDVTFSLYIFVTKAFLGLWINGLFSLMNMIALSQVYFIVTSDTPIRMYTLYMTAHASKQLDAYRDCQR